MSSANNDRQGGREVPGGVNIFSRSFRSLAGMAGVLVLVVTLFIIWSDATYGDFRSGWLRLGGYQLIAEQYLLDLGTVPAGESRLGTFWLQNLTGSSIVILGVQSDCSCLTTAELPIAIPGGAVFGFEVLFLADKVDSETEVIRRMILNVSVDQPIQVLEIRVTIIPNNKEKQSAT